MREGAIACPVEMSLRAKPAGNFLGLSKRKNGVWLGVGLVCCGYFSANSGVAVAEKVELKDLWAAAWFEVEV